MPTRVIVRLPNWLGDTVMAVPALRALRTGWPEARILVAGPWAEVMAGQELADVLVSYPRAWRGRLATADTIRAWACILARTMVGRSSGRSRASSRGAARWPRRV